MERYWGGLGDVLICEFISISIFINQRHKAGGKSRATVVHVL